MRNATMFLGMLLAIMIAPTDADALSTQSARYKRWLRDGFPAAFQAHAPAVQGAAEDYRTCGTGPTKEGTLWLRRNAQEEIVGFTCIFDPDHVCSAGLDGRFQTCTFPPDLRAFPGPVNPAVVQNPQLLLTEMDTRTQRAM